jgi:hypothetical protein
MAYTSATMAGWRFIPSMADIRVLMRSSLTMLAGDHGSADGSGNAARFNGPRRIEVKLSNKSFVSRFVSRRFKNQAK